MKKLQSGAVNYLTMNIQCEIHFNAHKAVLESLFDYNKKNIVITIESDISPDEYKNTQRDMWRASDFAVAFGLLESMREYEYWKRNTPFN